MLRSTSIAACAAIALSLSAAPAFGARYATPSGSATASCADLADACSLATAVDGHGTNTPTAGEEIIVEPGSYTLSAPLAPTVSGLQIHGVAGQAMPTIGTTGQLGLNAPDEPTNLSYLGFTEIVDGGGTLDRLLIDDPHPRAGIVACQCTGGVLRDSVVIAGNASGGAVGYIGQGDVDHGLPIREDLRNDTIVGDQTGAAAILIDHTGVQPNAVSFTAENVIAENLPASTPSQPGADGAVVEQAQGQQTTLVLTNSDVVGQDVKGTGASIITAIGDLPTPAQFVAPLSNLQIAPGAPTIDAGVNDPKDGPLDFAGNARTAGLTTDIGAYEYQPPSAPGTPPPAGATQPGVPGVPQLRLIHRSVTVSRTTGAGRLAATCTDQPGITCTVSGVLTARLRHHHASSTVGSVSGAVPDNAAHASLKVTLTHTALVALRGQSGSSPSLTTTAELTTGALGVAAQRSYSVIVHITAPPHPKHTRPRP